MRQEISLTHFSKGSRGDWVSNSQKQGFDDDFDQRECIEVNKIWWVLKLELTSKWLQQQQQHKHSYCAFHEYANSKVQKAPSQLRFSLPSIIITITSNEPWNTETHKTDRNPPITNHKPWPFEPVKLKFCSLRGPLRWLTAAKNVVSWSLWFGIFEKGRIRGAFCWNSLTLL